MLLIIITNALLPITFPTKGSNHTYKDTYIPAISIVKPYYVVGFGKINPTLPTETKNFRKLR